MAWWDDWVGTEAPHWTFNSIPAAKTPDRTEAAGIPADGAYVIVRLRSLFVPHVRKGLSRFHGAVHSRVVVQHRSGTPAEFQVVATPDVLQNAEPKHLHRVVHFNRVLCGPVPYRGSPVELRIGLFSVRAADLSAPYLSLLETLSSLSGVTFVAAAKPFLEPIKKGVELLTGSEDAAALEIGLVTDLDPVRTGWYLVARQPGHLVDGRFSVDPTDYGLRDESGAPAGGFPYFVFTVEQRTQRDDWFNIPDIKAAHAQLDQDVSRDIYPEARKSFDALTRTIRRSHDLLRADADRLVLLVTQDFESAMPATSTRGPQQKKHLRPLGDLPLYE